MKQLTMDEYAYARAARIAGRSLTRSKMPGKFYPVDAGPLYATGGSGAFVRAGHRQLIDMVCALGAVSLGYDYSYVREDARQTVFSLPSVAEGEAAEEVLTHLAPWATSVRFVKTGSEATHAAYRIAKRADDNRDWVLMGDWAYHGWHEWCEHRKKPTENFPMESFHTQLYTHGQDLQSAFGDGVHPLNIDPEEIAAIFLEPHRWEKVDEIWLRALRTFCTKHGILLVFDEMIYGGRWALGGATEYFGVTPDLACFGKAIGNGAAVACVVGKEPVAEHGDIVSGTFSGDVSGLGALCQTLSTYAETNVIEQLWKRGRQLQRGLQWVLQDHPDCGAVLEGQPVHQRLRFADEARQLRFGAEMVKRGVLWHPACVNVMLAHTADMMERVVDAAGESLKAMGPCAS